MKLYKYIPYNPRLKSAAADLRLNMTDSEEKVWKYLKTNFPVIAINRQKPLDQFIADFYCSKYSFIIEVDGKIHSFQKEKDKERDDIFLLKYGIKTIRITNEEVEVNIDIIRERLIEAVPSLIKEG